MKLTSTSRTKIILTIPAVIASVALLVLIMRAFSPDRPVITGVVETTN